MNVYQKSVFAGIWISLELVAILFELNHLLLKGLITLLNEAFYLDRLINFSPGKQEEEKQHGGLGKEKAKERDGLVKTSPSTPLSSCPQGIAALAWPEHAEMEAKSLTRHPRPTLSSLLALEVAFLPYFIFLPLSPYCLPGVGAQQMNHQAKTPPAPSPHCKTCF